MHNHCMCLIEIKIIRIFPHSFPCFALICTLTYSMKNNPSNALTNLYKFLSTTDFVYLLSICTVFICPAAAFFVYVLACYCIFIFSYKSFGYIRLLRAKLSWKGCELTKYIQIDLVSYIDGYPEKIENKRQYKQYICYNAKAGSSFYHITKTIKLFYLRQISKIKYIKHFQTKDGIKYV